MKNKLLFLIFSVTSIGFASAQTASFDCEADTKIAVKYLVGSKVYGQDISKGLDLLTQYADQGCADAQLKLGETYKKAQYVAFNADKAFYYTKLAADKGNDKATTLLAKLCNQGIGCENLTKEEKSNIYISTLDQMPCEKKAKKAFEFIQGSQLVAADHDKGMELLEKFAEQGCPDANYLLGLLYKKSFKGVTEHDYDKAYYYLKQAVDLGHIRAHAHLGQLHERGWGCKLDYEKAFELFEACYNLGDAMGAYCIGYDYMKGLGTVEQDYDKAILWFEKGDYPMAKHWLAVLHYFGYGTTVDKDKAIELLVNNNGILNSPRLLDYLEKTAHDPATILGDFEAVDINQETEKINEIITSEQETTITNEVQNDQVIDPVKTISGNWEGKLVELDWSGQQIVRYFPVSLAIQEDKDTGGVSYQSTINGASNAGVGILLENSLYFDNLEISVPKLYKDNLVDNLDINLLSADIEVKTLDYIQYMTAFVDSKILNWNEPGTPMLLILANKSITTDNGIEISEEVINALLASQGDNFINLYPNPFQKDLLIQYELVEDAYSTVEVYSLDGLFYNKIVDNELQTKGDKIFYFDGSELQRDQYYAIRVTANNKVHTKLIIKQ